MIYVLRAGDTVLLYFVYSTYKQRCPRTVKDIIIGRESGSI